jgi:XTP/dITP diphosphohydrolase
MRHAADPTPIICHGSWEGHISFEQKGKLGFGYDPIFIVNELNCHAAELDKVTKNKISHRGKAIKYLLSQLSSLK